MELINRYLQAVKFWLPKNQKQDIIAELAEDLRSQIEDREAELGRKLNESEVADLLKQRGRPVLVANRYRPQQHLIGPVLFPIYLFVLEVVAAFYLLPWILVWITVAIFRPVHPGQSLIATIGSFWTSFWPMAFLHGRKHHHRIRDSRESSGQVQVYGAVGPAQTAAGPRSQPDTAFHLGHGVDCEHSVLQLVAVVGRRALVPDAHSLGRCNRHPGADLAVLLLGLFAAWSGEHSGFCSQCFPSLLDIGASRVSPLVRWRRFRDLLADEGQHCSGDQCRKRRSGKNRSGRTRDQLVGGKIVSLGGRCLRTHRPEQRVSDHPRSVQ